MLGGFGEWVGVLLGSSLSLFCWRDPVRFTEWPELGTVAHRDTPLFRCRLNRDFRRRFQTSIRFFSSSYLLFDSGDSRGLFLITCLLLLSRGPSSYLLVLLSYPETIVEQFRTIHYVFASPSLYRCHCPNSCGLVLGVKIPYVLRPIFQTKTNIISLFIDLFRALLPRSLVLMQSKVRCDTPHPQMPSICAV